MNMQAKALAFFCAIAVVSCERVTEPQHDGGLLNVVIKSDREEYVLADSTLLHVTISIENRSGYVKYLPYCGPFLNPWIIRKKEGDSWQPYSSQPCQMIYAQTLEPLKPGEKITIECQIEETGEFRFECPIHFEKNIDRFYQAYSNIFYVVENK